MADKGSGFQSTDLSLLSLIQSRRLRKEIISFSYKTEIFVIEQFLSRLPLICLEISQA